MAQAANQIEVYLEIGQTRTFAAALDWPGWCRSGRDEDAALQALFEYGPRYARVLQRTQLHFHARSEPSGLLVLERLAGNTTTNFGAPTLPLSSDTQPIGQAELERYQAVLKACWRPFDRAVQAATGAALRKGPRGGGRDRDKMIEHVIGADHAYAREIGLRLPEPHLRDRAAVDAERRAVLEVLGRPSDGGPLAERKWTQRYAARRIAWHALDHAWEMEDRSET